MLCGLGLASRPHVVDLGAGTGQFTLEVAERASRVVAVDVSPHMLAQLRGKLEQARVANVECVQAGFLTYEHTGAPADLVYSRLALHHLPDFWKAVALARIADLLAPGGLLRLSDVVYGFEPRETAASFERWLGENASPCAADGWTRAELEEHLRDEHSTLTWLLEPMLAHAGFAIVDATYSDDAMLASYVCRRAPAVSQPH